MKRTIFFLFLLLMLFSIPTAVFAKGPAALMTISGPGLAKPVEITNSQVLEQYIPFMDDFFAPGQNILAQPPKTDRFYQVSFYYNDDADRPQLRYAFQYAPGDPGAIYLPGRGEPGYTLNVGTILRDGKDGHWIRASQSWDRFMQRILNGQIDAAAPSAQYYSSLWVFTVFGVAAAALLVFLLYLLVRRNKRAHTA